MLLSLLANADAAGFHFLRAELIGGAAEAVPEAGVGVSALSDILAGWITFGDPATDGHVVRAWRVQSSFYGPVLGVVPPTFRGIVPPHDVPFAMPWVHASLGGDASTFRAFEADLAGHYLFNVPGLWELDPRRGYVGPSLGIGAEGTVWHDAPATGQAKAEAGFLAGVTVRDTWYVQARSVGSIDLFGDHRKSLDSAMVTGVFLDRVGIPAGVELRGELAHGDDTRSGELETSWAVRASVLWKLVPPFQTRIEENLERRRREEDAREAAPQTRR